MVRETKPHFFNNSIHLQNKIIGRRGIDGSWFDFNKKLKKIYNSIKNAMPIFNITIINRNFLFYYFIFTCHSAGKPSSKPYECFLM